MGQVSETGKSDLGVEISGCDAETTHPEITPSLLVSFRQRIR